MTIEAGRYKARATEWKLGVTKNGGEQIGVLFQLDDGQTITWYSYFTEKTVERTLESLEHMGWDGRSITDPKGLDLNEVSLVVEMEKSETDDKMYPRVRWVNRIGGAGISMKEELAGNNLRNFGERMQGMLLSRQQNKPAQSQKRSAPARGGPHGTGDPDDYYDDLPI